MLQKLDSFMQQSPDVQDVTIDFGDAPAHGRWRATWLRITYDSGRRVTWKKRWLEGFGGHADNSLYYPPRPGERIVHIQLKSWELLE